MYGAQSTRVLAKPSKTPSWRDIDFNVSSQLWLAQLEIKMNLILKYYTRRWDAKKIIVWKMPYTEDLKGVKYYAKNSELIAMDSNIYTIYGRRRR